MQKIYKVDVIGVMDTKEIYLSFFDIYMQINGFFFLIYT